MFKPSYIYIYIPYICLNISKWIRDSKLYPRLYLYLQYIPMTSPVTVWCLHQACLMITAIHAKFHRIPLYSNPFPKETTKPTKPHFVHGEKCFIVK